MAIVACTRPAGAAPHFTSRPTIMVPAGIYYPFFRTASGADGVNVREFRLDRAPVTRAEYLEFVQQHPAWRKSNIKPLFAELNYLADWPGDLNVGPAPSDTPVTFVSWFAARAYCSAQGKRLPTVAEWERVAGSELRTAANSGGEPFRFAMGSPAPDLKARRIEVGGVWEWNADFNSAPLANRAQGEAGEASSLFCGDGYRSTNAVNYGAFLRYSLRSSLRGSYALKNLGFRCAQDAP